MPHTGFTLIELMLSLFLAAALVVFSSLSWRAFTDKQILGHGFNRLQDSILFARNHALTIARPVSVCASRDGQRCGGLAYEHGWIVFEEGKDENHGQRNADETILAVQPALAKRLSARASASLAPALTFSHSGRLVAAGRIVFCLDNNPDQARAMVFIRSGRVRTVGADELSAC